MSEREKQQNHCRRVPCGRIFWKNLLEATEPIDQKIPPDINHQPKNQDCSRHYSPDEIIEKRGIVPAILPGEDTSSLGSPIFASCEIQRTNAGTPLIPSLAPLL